MQRVRERWRRMGVGMKEKKMSLKLTMKINKTVKTSVLLYRSETRSHRKKEDLTNRNENDSMSENEGI